MAHAQSSAGRSSMDQGGRPVPALPRIRRRNRIITSCLECRRRKLKCDKNNPCSNCVKFSRTCFFLSPGSGPAPQEKLKQFKEEIDTLGKGYTADVDLDASPDYTGQDAQDEIEESEHIDPSPLTVEDVAYDDDADDLMDLGVQLGKMRITERIGGFARPKLYEELTHSLSHDLVGKKGSDAPETQVNEADAAISTGPSYTTDPSSDYIPPNTDFLFAGASSEESYLYKFLPPREMADALMAHYWIAVHPIACITHGPSFQRQYERFWQDLNNGFEPPSSVSALIFAAMFSSVTSMSNATVLTAHGVDRTNLLIALRLGCEKALCQAKLLQTTKVSTLQALTMYLIPLCRAQISRAHASLVSLAIRLAECAGLHRDGTKYGLRTVDVHVRRLVWHQLCFLDMRTSDAVGPRPQIRKEDYDTKFPLNIDENELDSLIPPKLDSARFTTITITRMRFEISEFHREVMLDRVRLEKRQTTLTAVLRRIEEFRRDMEKKWGPLLDQNVPIQKYTLKLLRLLTLKFPVFVLHRYAVSPAQELQEKLRDVVMAAAVEQLEHAIEVETTPAWQQWVWYSGTYNQYHAALLLIILAHQYPEQREVDRAWPILDYAFELPDHLNREQKVTLVMKQLQKKLEEYQSHRRLRAPTEMEMRMNTNVKPVPAASAQSPQKPRSLSPQAIGQTPMSSTTISNTPASSNDINPSTLAPNNAISFVPPMREQGFDPAMVSSVGITSRMQGQQPFDIPQQHNGNPTFNYPMQDAEAAHLTPPDSGFHSAANSELTKQSSRSTTGASPSSTVDLDIDVDWSGLDKLFPPNYNPFSFPQQNYSEGAPEGMELPAFTYFAPPSRAPRPQ